MCSNCSLQLCQWNYYFFFLCKDVTKESLLLFWRNLWVVSWHQLLSWRNRPAFQTNDISKGQGLNCGSNNNVGSRRMRVPWFSRGTAFRDAARDCSEGFCFQTVSGLCCSARVMMKCFISSNTVILFALAT